MTQRIALVTGGTRGIGASISGALKNADYAVAAVYQSNNAAAEKFSRETGIEIFSWNVADYESCAVGIEKVCATLGGPVDILINNAGITKDAMLHKMLPEDWNKVVNTNLNSVFNMCRCVVPSMRSRGFGRIVNISSVNALKGQVGQANYSAAKAGVLGFTKTLALESAAKNITVNAVVPGYIATEMTDILKGDIREEIIAGIPIGRFGKVEEVASAVLFLVSDDASFITGTLLSVNGGQYL
ncbi:MAG: acetoacetyl-CoA reductase [Holosporaceae bacterium]|nr:acetoacetyl-CoA reductase [Holosporaceae bacterium]